MIAEQLHSGNILEKIDGAPKPKDLLRSEYGLMKMQAISSMRNAHFTKRDLMEDFKQTLEQIEALVDDYYNGKIVRDDYDESYRKKRKAEFVTPPKD